MSKEIQKVEASLSSPKSLVAFSVQLKDFIVKQNLYTNIQGKNYVNVEGWQFAGGNLGLMPVVESCERLDRGEEITYRSSVALYSGEKIVSRGIAICSSKEKGKDNKDEYVIASMAQTRAEGKAYRLILGWLMKVAGYEATPAEEIPKEGFGKQEETLEKLGFCDHCGAQGQKSAKGFVFCPNWKKHKEAGEKVSFVFPPEPLSEAEQDFIKSLD